MQRGGLNSSSGKETLPGSGSGDISDFIMHLASSILKGRPGPSLKLLGVLMP